MAEDVADLLAGLAATDAAVAAAPSDRALAEAVVWPGTAVLEVPVATPLAALVAAAARGYDEAAVLAPDVPDLPALHVGKLFRALGSHPVAVSPAAGGGAAGLAARLPLPAWLADRGAAAPSTRGAATPDPATPGPATPGPATPDRATSGPATPDRATPGSTTPGFAALSLDDLDLATLRRLAGPRQVAATPGWHRLRRPEDVGRLDPGLEGWEATRALLSR